jgi:oxalate decarboxylase/phosphoglucose isomerase-like protein (cupin superfamily)
MDAELDGYAWLPRMIDKARAARAGTLGDAVHPCPVDRRTLKQMGVGFEDFTAVIARTTTDDEVLAELRALGAKPASEAWFDALAWEDALQEMVWRSEGESITDRAEREVLILATTPELTVTWSRYSHGERGPDLHLHHEHTDAFFVLTGSMRYEVGPHGERVVDAPAGTLVVVPPLVGHSFFNAQAEDVTWLNIHAPDAGFARFLRTGEDFDSAGVPLDDGTRGLGADLATVVAGEAYTYAGAGFAFSTDGYRADVRAGAATVSYCVV